MERKERKSQVTDHPADVRTVISVFRAGVGPGRTVTVTVIVNMTDSDSESDKLRGWTRITDWQGYCGP